MVIARDQVTFGDLERAARDLDPQLGELLVRYLEQEDPGPGAPEEGGEAVESDDGEGDEPVVPRAPAGALTLARLRGLVSGNALRGKTATERKLARREAWQAAAGSPWMPPRMRLGQLLLALDDAGSDAARAALVTVFTEGRLGWGVWQAAKAIYKRAEARHDALLFGALAYRFDVLGNDARGHHKDELGPGTILYMKRRAWRWLRHLGQAVPEAYPAFAIEVLRHYAGSISRSWVAAHIWGRKALRGAKRPAGFLLRPLAERAFPDAWKLSPAPLLRLLLEARHPVVAGWAIAALEADHGAALHALTPAQLAELGRRDLDGVIPGFVVKLLRARPDLHGSHYRALGLHDVVLGFLRSPNAAVAGFAVEYARTHAPELPIELLVELVELTAPGQREVVAFALDRLGALSPQQLGLPALVRLVATPASRELAIAKLKAGVRPGELPTALFVALATGAYAQLQFVIEWFGGAGVVIPVGHWTAALADPRCTNALRKRALEELGKRSGAELGAAWLQAALEQPALADTVAGWLEAGKLGAGALDVAWVKSLVPRPRLRALALRLLANRNLVVPASIGLGWLLELARSSEPELHDFAQRLLLEHFRPEDFADGGGHEAGLTRLWELAAGARSPEPVRAFASTYLRAHHPELGPQLPEARALGVTPRLTHADYPAARVRPLLDDPRADVRRLACAITGEEVVRWGDRALPYRLANSAWREPRVLGNELLLGAGDGADARLPADWLDGAQLFALAESPHKGTREAALTIIRRAYDRIGGRERLAWLMESAERDVRLFAVRLFWDRHRPRAKGTAEPLAGGDAELDGLRQFVRTVLFGLPPGRLEKRDPIAGVTPERPLPASVAKRRLLEAVRDLAVADAGFAALVVPVVMELAASAARGEWQTAVTALATIRRAHPGLGTLGLPAAREHPAHPVPRGETR